MGWLVIGFFPDLVLGAHNLAEAVFSRTSATSRQRNSAVSSIDVPRKMQFAKSPRAINDQGAATSVPVIGITEPVTLDFLLMSPGGPSPLLSAVPIINVLASLILRKAISFLNFTFQLITTTVDHIEIIIGELAPFFLNFAFDLLPISLDPIPVHLTPP
jgi:hypothetical protein